MHRKNNPNKKRNAYLIVGCSALSAIIIAVLVIFFAGGSNGSTTLQNVVQPASAAQIAKNLNCVGFKDAGPSEVGGSTDSGSCYIGADKYAINTFPSKDVRNSWLKTAEQLGVNPKWQTDTSVVYPSVS